MAVKENIDFKLPSGFIARVIAFDITWVFIFGEAGHRQFRCVAFRGRKVFFVFTLIGLFTFYIMVAGGGGARSA